MKPRAWAGKFFGTYDSDPAWRGVVARRARREEEERGHN